MGIMRCVVQYIAASSVKSVHCLTRGKGQREGPCRRSNPGPLEPKSRIIPLDHRANMKLQHCAQIHPQARTNRYVASGCYPTQTHAMPATLAPSPAPSDDFSSFTRFNILPSLRRRPNGLHRAWCAWMRARRGRDGRRIIQLVALTACKVEYSAPPLRHSDRTA